MEPIEYAEVADVSPPKAGSVIEQLLSPQMLQRMMACSGALLVLGFVGWLWSIGIFKEPLVAAFTIGAANLVVLGLGISLVRFSRYQLAGNGLTLLASLALPLNLWFYDAQGLVTLADGGHLWMPAAVCCGIYAFIAHILRKPIFVYTLVGGLVMTGLLLLADQEINVFWQLMPQVSFLVGLGWASFFAERLFPAGDSDFSRKKFGYAFRWAGLPVVGVGFSLLFAGQFAGVIADAFSLAKIPLVATSEAHQLWAIGLLLGSAVLCALDRIAGTRAKVSTVAAIAFTLWAGLTTLDLFSIQLQLPHFAIGMAILYITSTLRNHAESNLDDRSDSANLATTDISVVSIVGISFFALLQFFAQYVVAPGNVFFATEGFLVVAQMLATAAVCYVGWKQNLGVDQKPTAYLCTSSTYAVLGGLSLAAALDVSNLNVLAAICFVAPVAYVLGGLLLAKPDRVEDWQLASITGTGVLLFGVLVAGIESSPAHVHLSCAWILGVASAVIYAASIGRKAPISSRTCYLFAVVAVSRVMAHFGLSSDYSLVLSATVSGLSVLAIAAFGKSTAGAASGVSKWAAFEDGGNTLVFIGGVIGFLLSVNRLIGGEESLQLLGLAVFQIAAIVVAGLMASSRNWRLTFRAIGVMNVLVVVAMVNNLINAHPVQRAELCVLLVGIALLVLGHIAWYREGETQDEVATLSLWSGSLLVAVPLGVGLLFYRSFEVNATWGNWWFFHEATSIAAALALLALGMSCRIRSTVICGSALLTTYLVSVLAMIQWPSQLQSVSLVMMVGGGFFFAVALVLSIYRDRLLSIPADIREGNGMFKVLRWR